MLELMERLIDFKYSCKLNHWTTKSYSEHLLFDRLQEGIDDIVDNIAEKYFMATNQHKLLTSSLVHSKYINSDLIKLSKDIVAHIDVLLKDESLPQGILSLLGAISETFNSNLGLLTMK